jgi:Ca2+-binding EF-hand superfamily protein
LCYVFLCDDSIDTETYVTDFDSIDKDSDGSISYVELCSWIEANAKKDPEWNVFKNNKNVLAIAHKNASVGMNRNGESQHRNLRPEKVLS